MLSSSDLSTWRVLIVDDEPDNLHLAREILCFSGATVAEAQSGPKALDAAAQFAPNVILLDLAMPGMNGFEVKEAMQAHNGLDGVPIIALTALAMPHDARRVREAGFHGYITKPFMVHTLIKEIAAAVAAFQQVKQQTHD